MTPPIKYQEKNKYYRHRFFVQGPTVWNKIPAHIREADSVELFKKQYKKEILGKK